MEQAFNAQAKVKSPALRPPLQRCSSFKIAHTPWLTMHGQLNKLACLPDAAAAAQSQVLNNETVVGYYVYAYAPFDSSKHFGGNSASPAPALPLSFFLCVSLGL